MKKISLLSVLLALFILPVTNSFSQEVVQHDVLGIWLNADKDAHVQIYKEKDEYFGKIVWLKTPDDKETGEPRTDVHNPDAELQKRPVMGLLLLSGLEFDDDEWDDGTIYDPKSGKTYSCYMEFPDDDNLDKLKIRGYIGVSLIGRTTYWTRVK